MANCCFSYLLGKIHSNQTPRFSHQIKRWVGGFVRLSTLTFWGRCVLICRYILNYYMANSCFWPPSFFSVDMYYTHHSFLCPIFRSYTPRFQCVSNRKACYTPAFQCVLDRKACHALRFSMCVKSKSIDRKACPALRFSMCVKSKSMLCA